MTPWFSLIVCTRNRVERLRGLVKSLDAARVPGGVEVIFVDNGSTDGTADYLRTVASGPLKATVRKEPKRGLSSARNLGLEAARADLIGFTDDDCRLAPDYFSSARELERRGAYDFFGGRVLPVHRSEICAQTSLSAAALAPGIVLRSGVIHGANMVVRRRVFESIGGFDEGLGAGSPLCSGEDLQLLARALDGGFRGRYSPELVVFHDSGRVRRRDRRRARMGYDYGRGAFYAERIRSGRPKYLLYWMSTWYPWSAARIRREIRGAALYLSRRAR